MFVLDFIPQEYLKGGAKDSVAIFTAGWAMKFTPLIGRALRQLVIDGFSEYALDEFKITRHGSNADETIIEPPPQESTQTEENSKSSILMAALSLAGARGTEAENKPSWQERKPGGSSMRA